MSSTIVHRPRERAHALEVLRAHGEDAAVVAGGTAFTILWRAGLLRPGHVVSLAAVPGLDSVEAEDDVLTLGATVTLRDVERHPAVRRLHPVVAGTLGVVANPRVRNVATVGGNLAEADPTSDLPAVLCCCDAEAVVASADDERRVPVGDLTVDWFETSLAPDEMVVAVRVPVLGSGWGGRYVKLAARHAEDRTCVGVAAFVRTGPDEAGGPRVLDVRVTAVGVGPVPLRLPDAERAYVAALADRSSAQDDGALRALADAYVAASDPVSDTRGSEWYRRRVLGRLLEQAVVEAGSADDAAVLL